MQKTCSGMYVYEIFDQLLMITSAVKLPLQVVVMLHILMLVTVEMECYLASIKMVNTLMCKYFRKWYHTM